MEHGISDLDATSQAIRRAVAHSQSSRKYAVVAVSQTHVITRTLSLPAGFSEGEIEEQVMIEAAQQIPHPLDEIFLDFSVTGGARDGSDDQVLITACRREIVEDYAAVLELAGLTASVVDISLFAIERGFSFIANSLGEDLEGRAIGSWILEICRRDSTCLWITAPCMGANKISAAESSPRIFALDTVLIIARQKP